MDLRQFFPSVNLKAIHDRLLSLKVAPSVIDYLDSINRNNPKLPKKLCLDESKYIQQEIQKKRYFD